MMTAIKEPYDPHSEKRHDRTGFYSRTANLTFDEIPDPFVHVSEREPVERLAGSEWIVPAVPTLVVARTRRADPIGARSGSHV
jgi:hypothetical protein